MGRVQIKREIGPGKLGINIEIKYKNIDSKIPEEDIEVLSNLKDELDKLINKYKVENGW